MDSVRVVTEGVCTTEVARLYSQSIKISPIKTYVHWRIINHLQKRVVRKNIYLYIAALKPYIYSLGFTIEWRIFPSYIQSYHCLSEPNTVAITNVKN